MEILNIIPREPSDNNRQYAYKLLRQNIMTMILPPGTTLNENSISERLNISRTPVHEALISLKAEGLVDIIPQSGSKVTMISLACVREGLFLRTSIEPEIYRLLAGNIPPQYLDEMRKNLELIGNYMNREEGITITEFISLDDEFHRIAYYASQKENLWKARLAVCSHYDRIRYQGSLSHVQDLNRIHQEHLKIYEHLILGASQQFDFDEYYKEHLGYFKQFFSKLYQKNPEFFVN